MRKRDTCDVKSVYHFAATHHIGREGETLDGIVELISNHSMDSEGYNDLKSEIYRYHCHGDPKELESYDWNNPHTGESFQITSLSLLHSESVV